MEFREFTNSFEEDYNVNSSLSGNKKEENNVGMNNDNLSIEDDFTLDDVNVEENSKPLEKEVNYLSNYNLEEESDFTLADANPEEWSIDEDIFFDENIETTLKKYNYDYKALMRELTTFIDYSELLEILTECGIKKEEYLNPTYVTFEKVRDKIIHKNKSL